MNESWAININKTEFQADYCLFTTINNKIGFALINLLGRDAIPEDITIWKQNAIRNGILLNDKTFFFPIPYGNITNILSINDIYKDYEKDLKMRYPDLDEVTKYRDYIEAVNAKFDSRAFLHYLLTKSIEVVDINTITIEMAKQFIIDFYYELEETIL